MKKVVLKDKRILTLRHAEKSDAVALVDFYNSISGETDFLSFGEGEFLRSPKEQEEIIEKLHEQSNGIFMLAEVDNQIVGAITFSGGARIRFVHAGEFGIGISRDYWGLGIGRIMIEALIKWAKQSKVVRKIDLRVRTDNTRAIHLYQNMGFIIEGRITRDSLIRGIFYDCYSMGLHIN